MSHGYGKRRHKLKSHDAGDDRHNKGIAYVNKVNRLDLKHQRTVSGMRRRKKKPPTILQQLEQFDSER